MTVRNRAEAIKRVKFEEMDSYNNNSSNFGGSSELN